MKKIGYEWGNERTVSVIDDEVMVWQEGWYTDLTFTKFKRHECRFCMAKYDGVPYFLFIFLFVMFRFGKYGHWD